MAPTGAMIQMYGAQHAQGVQRQSAHQPSAPIPNPPVSTEEPLILSKTVSVCMLWQIIV